MVKTTKMLVSLLHHDREDMIAHNVGHNKR